MRKIRPYKTLAAARRALDNGGRLWDLFERAGDDRVSRQELARAANVFGQSKAFLHYALATEDLAEEEREELRGLLDPIVRRSARFYLPERTTAAAFEEGARAGRPYLLEGELRRLGRDDLTWNVHSFIMVGSVMMPVVTPLTEAYKAYSLVDESGGDCRVLLGSLGPEGPARFVGLAKKLDGVERNGEKGKLLYFAPVFYSQPEKS